jgi:hypothetical protein
MKGFAASGPQAVERGKSRAKQHRTPMQAAMRIARTIAIWVFGLLAAGLVGWGLGRTMDPSLGPGGLIAGLSAFICLRLWLSEVRAKSN